MPNISRTNKGVAAGAHKKRDGLPHKLNISSQQNKPARRKNWWEHIVANQEEKKVN